MVVIHARHEKQESFPVRNNANDINNKRTQRRNMCLLVGIGLLVGVLITNHGSMIYRTQNERSHSSSFTPASSSIGGVGYSIENKNRTKRRKKNEPRKKLVTSDIYETAVNETSDTDVNYRCKKAVSHLITKDINFIALDFDLTIVDIHTGGNWEESSLELANHVRPMFRCLIDSAVSSGLHVAVVTFSSQKGLISNVMEHHFSRFASNIPIEGGLATSKREHILMAKTKIEKANPGSKLSKSSTLLIDDDPKNIARAQKDGVLAISLDPQHSLRVFDDIINAI